MNPHLEIVIITYNRSKYLKRTLKALADSSFSQCKITILDNCSSDDTPIVIEEAVQRLQFLNSYSHAKNIGGNANILRAYEMATYPYLWLMGDDDIIYIEQADEVLRLCAEGKADLINLIQAPFQVSQPRGLHNLKHYARCYRYLFFQQSLITAVITKTSLISGSTIEKAYHQIASFFPHLVFTNEAIERNGLIYFLDKPLISRDDDLDTKALGQSGGRLGLVWYLWWCEACRIIKDPKIRSIAMKDGFLADATFEYILTQILEFRLSGNPFNFHCYLRVLSVQPKTLLLACILLSPVYILPRFAVKLIDLFYRMRLFPALNRLMLK
jgi:glycosyltransferase involved in cell wall biosynthesis